MCGIAGLYTKSATLQEHLGDASREDARAALVPRPRQRRRRVLPRSGAGRVGARCRCTRRDPSPTGRRCTAELEAAFGEASPAPRARHARDLRGRRRGRRRAGLARRAPSRAALDERRAARSRSTRRPARRRGSSSASRWPRSPARTRSATRGWRPRAASRPSTRTRSRPGSTCAWSTTARCRTTTACGASLQREGIRFQTDNDTEVAAGYLTWRMREGATLEQALEGCLDDLDGFYTFAVGTADGFAVLRDPIACKPAVMAETDEWVAMASEYRAIAVLPGAEDAVAVGARAGPGLQLGHRARWRDGRGRGQVTREALSRSISPSETRPRAQPAPARATAAPAAGCVGAEPGRQAQHRGRARRARTRSRSTVTSATTAPA